MNKRILIYGILFCLTAIILGAFGAHGLKDKISAEKLLSFETGVRYQLIHGLALLILGFQNVVHDKKWISICWIFGILLFSVSIYFLSISDLMGVNLRFLGPVTPLGGTFMIIGWFIFLLKVLKSKVD